VNWSALSPANREIAAQVAMRVAAGQSIDEIVPQLQPERFKFNTLLYLEGLGAGAAARVEPPGSGQGSRVEARLVVLSSAPVVSTRSSAKRAEPGATLMP
jgi:hypothetical protein